MFRLKPTHIVALANQNNVRFRDIAVVTLKSALGAKEDIADAKAAVPLTTQLRAFDKRPHCECFSKKAVMLGGA